MSDFEKVIQFDKTMTIDNGFERPVNIEKPDREYYSMKHPIIVEIRKNLREENEKIKSKTLEIKHKKTNPKLHVATVAEIQEKL